MMIVKFGGHAMKDSQGLFAQSIKSALFKGEKVIVVHGGGLRSTQSCPTLRSRVPL